MAALLGLEQISELYTVSGDVAFGHRSRLVAGIVVNIDDLNVMALRVGRVQRTVERLRQEIGPIVGWKDDVDLHSLDLIRASSTPRPHGRAFEQQYYVSPESGSPGSPK
jgi:hypothetical protein